MIKTKRVICLALLIVCLLLNVQALAAPSEIPAIVSDVIQAINNENIEDYISLFSLKNREWMNEYIDANGISNFFEEDSIELLEIKELSYNVGIMAAGITPHEMDENKNIVVFYAKEYITAKVASERINGGTQYKLYVTATEGNYTRLIRISEPAIDIITRFGEGFSDDSIEISQMAAARRSALYLPSTISVYFTKTANITYHGANRANIDFNTYVKNVIPNEWVVSYYSNYPEYLRAGALASKMYAWYHVVTPKWNFSPYYSDVVDSSSDQNYLATSYSSLASVYKTYVNSVMTDIGNDAFVKAQGGAEENIFEPHYYANAGTQYSGNMNASGALSLAQQGYTYENILRYYYDYCPNADGNSIVFRTHM